MKYFTYILRNVRRNPVRTFLTIAHNKFERNGATLEEKYPTRVEMDIEGNQRAAASVLAICVRMLADADDDEAIERAEDADIVEAFTKRTKRAARAGARS